MAYPHVGYRMCDTNLVGEHRALIRRYGGEYSVISAHMVFHGEGLDPRYHYLTCLREPLDRAISWLFFAINNHDEPRLGPLWHQAERFVMTESEELHEDQALARYIQNPYVEHFVSISDTRARSDADKLSGALSAIEQYNVCGLFEDFPAFLANVAALIGLPVPAMIGLIEEATGPRCADALLGDALRGKAFALLGGFQMHIPKDGLGWLNAAISASVYRAPRD